MDAAGAGGGVGGGGGSRTPSPLSRDRVESVETFGLRSRPRLDDTCETLAEAATTQVGPGLGTWRVGNALGTKGTAPSITEPSNAGEVSAGGVRPGSEGDSERGGGRDASHRSRPPDVPTGGRGGVAALLRAQSKRRMETMHGSPPVERTCGGAEVFIGGTSRAEVNGDRGGLCGPPRPSQCVLARSAGAEPEALLSLQVRRSDVSVRCTPVRSIGGAVGVSHSTGTNSTSTEGEGRALDGVSGRHPGAWTFGRGMRQTWTDACRSVTRPWVPFFHGQMFGRPFPEIQISGVGHRHGGVHNQFTSPETGQDQTGVQASPELGPERDTAFHTDGVSAHRTAQRGSGRGEATASEDARPRQVQSHSASQVGGTVGFPLHTLTSSRAGAEVVGTGDSVDRREANSAASSGRGDSDGCERPRLGGGGDGIQTGGFSGNPPVGSITIPSAGGNLERDGVLRYTSCVAGNGGVQVAQGSAHSGAVGQHDGRLLCQQRCGTRTQDDISGSPTLEAGRRVGGVSVGGVPTGCGEHGGRHVEQTTSHQRRLGSTLVGFSAIAEDVREDDSRCIRRGAQYSTSEVCVRGATSQVREHDGDVGGFQNGASLLFSPTAPDPAVVDDSSQSGCIGGDGGPLLPRGNLVAPVDEGGATSDTPGGGGGPLLSATEIVRSPPGDGRALLRAVAERFNLGQVHVEALSRARGPRTWDEWSAALRRFSEFCTETGATRDPDDPRVELDFMAWLAVSRTPATASKVTGSLRAVWAVWRASRTDKVVTDLVRRGMRASMPATRAPPGGVPVAVLLEKWKSMDTSTPSERRDRAMVLCALLMGTRPRDLTCLVRGDDDFLHISDSGDVRLRFVADKGSRLGGVAASSYVFVPNVSEFSLAEALSDVTDDIHEGEIHEVDGKLPLFVVLSGTRRGFPLNVDTVSNVLARFLESVGLSDRAAQARQIRAYVASSAYELGVDPQALCDHFRWKSVDTFRQHYRRYAVETQIGDQLLSGRHGASVVHAFAVAYRQFKVACRDTHPPSFVSRFIHPRPGTGSVRSFNAATPSDAERSGASDGVASLERASRSRGRGEDRLSYRWRTNT